MAFFVSTAASKMVQKLKMDLCPARSGTAEALVSVMILLILGFSYICGTWDQLLSPAKTRNRRWPLHLPDLKESMDTISSRIINEST